MNKINSFFKKVIWAVKSLPKIMVAKLQNGKRAKIDYLEHFESGVRLTFAWKSGTMKIQKCCHIKRGTQLHVSQEGILEIGSHVCINSNCYIASQNKISIGDGTEIAQNVVIIDHDHDYKHQGGIHAQKYNTTPVRIGKNVWIGANTVILRGTIVGDNCVIGAGCVLSGEYEKNSIIVQKRTTSVKKYE